MGKLEHCAIRGRAMVCKMVRPLRKTTWRVLKKLDIGSLYDPAIPRLGRFPDERRAGSGGDAGTPMFTAALRTAAKTGKHPGVRGRVDRRMDGQTTKMWCIHPVEYYSAVQRRKSYPMVQHG